MTISINLQALIMGVVEGLTEFLPISSTGHLILAGSALGFVGDKAKVFEIVIQLGAMFAVLWEYRERFTEISIAPKKGQLSRRFLAILVIACIPALAIGFFLGSSIKQYLFSPVVVAAAFILGGIAILIVEHFQKHRSPSRRIEHVDAISPAIALKVGAVQVLALIPGTSRSGATIIGGMLFGLSRRAATEFSFFLALPTLFAASAYSLYKDWHVLSSEDLPVFVLGGSAAFLSALACIRWLIKYVGSHDFSLFAWYRIAFGLLILATAYTGSIEWIS